MQQVCDPGLRVHTLALQAEGNNGFKDSNVLSQHFHGLFGNPGTNNIACDPSAQDAAFCVRGDNIFTNILPGQCGEYQYDIALEHAPGTYW